MSGIVRAVHQSFTKLGDTPLARLDLFESLPSRRFGCRASTTNSTTKSRSTSLYIGLTSSRAGCRALQLYSAPERSISLHLSALFTLILYTLPEGKILFPRDDSGQFLEVRGLGRSRHEGSRTTRNRPYPVLKCSRCVADLLHVRTVVGICIYAATDDDKNATKNNKNASPVPGHYCY